MKKYFFAAFALVLAIGFSAFTKPVKKDKSSLVQLTFVGNPMISSDVADETLYQDLISDPSCDQIREDKACGVEVQNTDLKTTNGVVHLDPAKINLSATAGAAGAADGYVPFKSGGSSSTTPTFLNRD